jgi:hypothetical protein
VAADEAQEGRSLRARLRRGQRVESADECIAFAVTERTEQKLALELRQDRGTIFEPVLAQAAVGRPERVVGVEQGVAAG